MSFWDWFFVPLWILTPFVMIFGAQAVFGDHLLLIILVLVYALGTIPYFMSKRGPRSPKPPARSAPGRHDAFATESADPSQNVNGRLARFMRILGNLTFPIEVLFVIVFVILMVLGTVLRVLLDPLSP